MVGNGSSVSKTPFVLISRCRSVSNGPSAPGSPRTYSVAAFDEKQTAERHVPVDGVRRVAPVQAATRS